MLFRSGYLKLLLLYAWKLSLLCLYRNILFISRAFAVNITNKSICTPTIHVFFFSLICCIAVSTIKTFASSSAILVEIFFFLALYKLIESNKLCFYQCLEISLDFEKLFHSHQIVLRGLDSVDCMGWDIFELGCIRIYNEFYKLS